LLNTVLIIKSKNYNKNIIIKSPEKLKTVNNTDIKHHQKLKKRKYKKIK